jgi:hypothetical protein
MWMFTSASVNYCTSWSDAVYGRQYVQYEKQTNSVAFSPRANYTDWQTIYSVFLDVLSAWGKIKILLFSYSIKVEDETFIWHVKKSEDFRLTEHDTV